MPPDLDIFIASGDQNFPDLCELLPKLVPHGRVHVFSSFLTRKQIRYVDKFAYRVYEPRYSNNGYTNFNITCCEQINVLAKAPYFVKLDTDIKLADDWIDYLKKCQAIFPNFVLCGPTAGKHLINVEITGRELHPDLGSKIDIREGRKITGSFYIGETNFWKHHDRTMRALSELLILSVAHRADNTNIFIKKIKRLQKGLKVKTDGSLARGRYKEDIIRCLTAHAVGASRRIAVVESDGLIVQQMTP